LYLSLFTLWPKLKNCSSDKNFRAVIDLVSLEILEWSEEHFGFDMTRTSVIGIFFHSRLLLNEKLIIWCIGTEYEENAKRLRGKLCEQVASSDEFVMDKLLTGPFVFFFVDILNFPIKIDILGEDISTEDLSAALRRITISRKGVVVMIGSSLKNKGVHSVLDSIIDFLPSPLEVRYL
jgi:elongation factor G